MNSITGKRFEVYQKELLQIIEDPIHKKIIQVYGFPNPVENMEDALSEILLEVLKNEDQERNN